VFRKNSIEFPHRLPQQCDQIEARHVLPGFDRARTQLIHKISIVLVNNRGVREESRFGRRLWQLVLLLALAYAVSGFVGHPVITSSASRAANQRPSLQLVESETDTDDEGGAVAAAAATALTGSRSLVQLRTINGSASEAIVQFMNGRARSSPSLLVLSSTTFSDLASERQDLQTTTAAMQAAVAEGLLARAEPVARLSSDRLALAVAPGSRIRSASQLLAQMRTDPGGNAFAMLDDTFSKTNFAALVARAQSLRLSGERAGYVPYRGYATAQEALASVADGAASVVLAPQAALTAAERAGLLRALPWPGATPRLWVALFASPSTSRAQLIELRRQLTRLTQSRRWNQMLRASGRSAAPLAPAQLARFEHSALRQAQALQALASRVAREQP
jgi:hypothetical protein